MIYISNLVYNVNCKMYTYNVHVRAESKRLNDVYTTVKSINTVLHFTVLFYKCLFNVFYYNSL